MELKFVRAAGGVIHRQGRDGLEVLLVHRSQYDDWSFPKGKCPKGEGDLDCALREIEEETGLRCEVGRPLKPSFYTDSRGRSKGVLWWEMTCAGEAAPKNEVDDVRWLTPEAAEVRLTYDRDRALLAELLEIL